MKFYKYQRRFYRDGVRAKDLHLTCIIDKETDLQILTNRRLDKELIKEKVGAYRWEIENYINKDRRFLTSLKPISVELRAPAIVQEMNKAARLVNVGPMAAVAGAIAEFLARDLLEMGYKEVIIENGGDIFLKTTKTRNVGIYTGKSRLWQDIYLKIRPQKTPLGICTSSGTVGHSLSFGSSDCVVILAKSAAFADAVATATANRVQTKQDLEKALDFAKSIKDVLGVVIIIDNNLISWGDIEFTR
jgi:hypothetical protein